jgi:hypothetical protein
MKRLISSEMLGSDSSGTAAKMLLSIVNLGRER